MPEEDEIQSILSKRNELLIHIEKLETSYNSGQVSKTDYEVIRNRYEKKLKEVDKSLGTTKSGSVRGKGRRAAPPPHARSARQRSSSVGLVVLIIIAVAVVAVLYLFVGKGYTPTGTELNQTAPDFALTGIDGDSFSLGSYRDNVVVLDFMATWCGPCITEMGHLKQLYTDYRNQGVVIMSIDVDPSQSNETIRQFKTSYGDNWIFASGSDAGSTYGATYIPTIYIINKQGQVAYKNTGVTEYATLAAEINKLL